MPYYSDTIDMIIISGGEEPPADVAAMYNNYLNRKEKWAYESTKYSVDKLKDHNYKYVAYALKCMEYISYDQKQEMREELKKALTFKLKMKIIYTQAYGSEPGIITSEGEGELVPAWSGKKMSLSGDIDIQTTISGFYEKFEYSPTEYKISTQARMNISTLPLMYCSIWYIRQNKVELNLCIYNKLPLGKPIDYELIGDIVQCRVKKTEKKVAQKKEE